MKNKHLLFFILLLVLPSFQTTVYSMDNMTTFNNSINSSDNPSTYFSIGQLFGYTTENKKTEDFLLLSIRQQYPELRKDSTQQKGIGFFQDLYKRCVGEEEYIKQTIEQGKYHENSSYLRILGRVMGQCIIDNREADLIAIISLITKPSLNQRITLSQQDYNNSYLYFQRQHGEKCVSLKNNLQSNNKQTSKQINLMLATTKQFLHEKIQNVKKLSNEYNTTQTSIITTNCEKIRISKHAKTKLHKHHENYNFCSHQDGVCSDDEEIDINAIEKTYPNEKILTKIKMEKNKESIINNIGYMLTKLDEVYILLNKIEMLDENK